MQGGPSAAGAGAPHGSAQQHKRALAAAGGPRKLTLWHHQGGCSVLFYKYNLALLVPPADEVPARSPARWQAVEGVRGTHTPKRPPQPPSSLPEQEIHADGGDDYVGTGSQRRLLCIVRVADDPVWAGWEGVRGGVGWGKYESGARR